MGLGTIRGRPGPTASTALPLVVSFFAVSSSLVAVSAESVEARRSPLVATPWWRSLAVFSRVILMVTNLEGGQRRFKPAALTPWCI